MSIELMVKPYCNNCSKFKPIDEALILQAGAIPQTHHIVFCQDHERCEAIYKQARQDIAAEKLTEG